jgi:hypothetical protein
MRACSPTIQLVAQIHFTPHDYFIPNNDGPSFLSFKMQWRGQP